MTRAIMMASICLAVIPLSAYTADAHEGHRMSEGHEMHMARQHKAMDDIQREWLAAKEAVEKGDSAKTQSAASKIYSYADGLDGFMLHKHAERRSEFLSKADGFRSLIAKFEGRARKGDTGALRHLVPEIDRACGACHQTFR